MKRFPAESTTKARLEVSRLLRDLKVEQRALSTLSPYQRNARTHSRKQIRKIAGSIEQFGFTNPVLVDGGGRIIAGHGRVMAAELLGLEDVPTIRLDHLSDAEKQAYILADNRLAELAGWDREILAIELQHLTALELDFDAEVTGFDTAEIDIMIEGLEAGEEEDEADALPPVDEVRPPVSRRGDLWLLGPHRLLCGDATAAEDYQRLLDRRQAQMVFADPPYNVPVDGHICGLGAVSHDDFAMASGEMSEEQFTAFLKTVFEHLAAHSRAGAIHFVFMDWRHLHEALSAGKAAFSELKNLCVWNKTNGGMGSLYRSKHELILVFKKGTAAHINNVELGRHGRNRSNIWDYAGINALGKARGDRLAMHPTVKPVALIADAIRDCSKRKGLVLDPFVGSGTTLIAAEKTGRRAAVMELEPRYVDLTIARWQALTGNEATHAETGLPFDAMRQRRDEPTNESAPKNRQEGDHGQ